MSPNLLNWIGDADGSMYVCVYVFCRVCVRDGVHLTLSTLYMHDINSINGMFKH